MPRPGNRFEKSKDFKGAMKRLFISLKKWHVLLGIVLILSMVSAVFALVAPNKLSDLTDEITIGIQPKISENIIKDIMADDKIPMEDKIKFQQELSSIDKDSTNEEKLKAIDNFPDSIKKVIEPKINMTRVKKIAIFLACLYIASSAFNYIQGFLMATVSNNFAKTLRKSISTKINKLPLKYFDSHETGDILSRITNDVDTMAQNMNQSLSSLVASMTLFIGSIIMMFVTNWIMAITAILASLFGFLFMGIILSKSQKYFVQRQSR